MSDIYKQIKRFNQFNHNLITSEEVITFNQFQDGDASVAEEGERKYCLNFQ